MVWPITDAKSYVGETGKSMKAVKLALFQKDGWRKISTSLIGGFCHPDPGRSQSGVREAAANVPHTRFWFSFSQRVSYNTQQYLFGVVPMQPHSVKLGVRPCLLLECKFWLEDDGWNATVESLRSQFTHLVSRQPRTIWNWRWESTSSYFSENARRATCILAKAVLEC
jgi:hypothetical protein